jgi:hypothetical protein
LNTSDVKTTYHTRATIKKKKFFSEDGPIWPNKGFIGDSLACAM